MDFVSDVSSPGSTNVAVPVNLKHHTQNEVYTNKIQTSLSRLFMGLNSESNERVPNTTIPFQSCADYTCCERVGLQEGTKALPAN
jgi:hypothetical protein